jgi:hypothetical protein
MVLVVDQRAVADASKSPKAVGRRVADDPFDQLVVRRR